MQTRVWIANGTNDWFDATAWVGATVPQPDDTAQIGTGTVEFASGETLNAATIDLGTPDLTTPPALVLQGALLGYQVTIDVTADGGDDMLATTAPSGFDGVLSVSASGGTLTIAAAAGLALLSDAVMTIDGGGTVLLDGTLDNHATVTVGNNGNFVNDGAIAQASAAFEVESGGTLGGPGLFEIGLYSSLNLQAGSAPSHEAVRFTDVGGRLLLDNPANFTGTVSNFMTGDLIDLTSIVANTATYNPANDLLSVLNNGVVVATLTLDAPQGDSFFTQGDGSTGTLVALDGTQTRMNYTIDAADRAMGANTVRATMTTLGGTPITGAGIRVGIISDSFDQPTGSNAPDAANAAAADGYLPENSDGTSAVTVLSDGSAGDSNEGLALAELVHQAAPGASLDFASSDGGLNSFANAVTALQQAGCTVIIDDTSYDSEPFFQDAGTLDSAIDAAVASGVTYITSAGNAGGDAYQASFTGTAETLYDGTNAAAQVFDNGTPYQSLTLIGGVTTEINLQWATPYQDGLDAGTLSLALFSMSGQLLATSTLDSGGTAAGTDLTYAPTSEAQYQLAIYGTVAAGTTFKYLLLGSSGGGTTVAGTIDDTEATAGTMTGHAMLPDVISVGADDFPETPAFGSSTTYLESYSDTGPSDFLYTAAGTPLPTPLVVVGPSVVAPVDSATTVFAPFAGTSAAAATAAGVAALTLQADPKLTPAQVQALLKQSATSLGQPAAEQGSGLLDAPAAVQAALAAAAACYAAGTRIATVRGPVAVEALRLGDLAVTASGARHPVVWLGHRRIDCQRHPRPETVWPVRVRAHAFAPGQPARDLYLSPDHAVFWQGTLIPVRHLLNGASVTQIAVPAVTYWHVELPRHDILLAEGLPAESFLDTGDRSGFANGTVVQACPDFARRAWDGDACAPLLVAGPALDAVRRHLARVRSERTSAFSSVPRKRESSGRPVESRFRGNDERIQLLPG